jgi:hypothetical protein
MLPSLAAIMSGAGAGTGEARVSWLAAEH